MFVKSHRGDGEVLTLNMLTLHVLHTPGHARGSPRDMSPLQPPLTRLRRPPPEQRSGPAGGLRRLSLSSLVQAAKVLSF